jgi:hypothetical protein
VKVPKVSKSKLAIKKIINYGGKSTMLGLLLLLFGGIFAGWMPSGNFTLIGYLCIGLSIASTFYELLKSK